MVFAIIPEREGLKKRILDPTCGTGGFLKTVIDHHRKKIEEQESKKWDNPKSVLMSVNERLRYMCNNNLFGIDFNPLLVRAAQMNLFMHGDGSTNIFHANSLLSPGEWKEDVRKSISMGSFDIIFTNPPFGENLSVDDAHVLDSYEHAQSIESHVRNTPENIFT